MISFLVDWKATAILKQSSLFIVQNNENFSIILIKWYVDDSTGNKYVGLTILLKIFYVSVSCACGRLYFCHFVDLRSKVYDSISLCFRVEWLIVDESDKLFEEGKTGFRDQVRTCCYSQIHLSKFATTIMQCSHCVHVIKSVRIIKLLYQWVCAGLSKKIVLDRI